MTRRTRRELIERLNRDARRIAARFGLRYRSIEAERANVKSRYGICYSDGSIRIRLHHASTGEALKYSSLVNTLCHELAHLRHFDHGPRFKTFYLLLLEWSRREGIYRPGGEGGRRRRPPAPQPLPVRRPVPPGVQPPAPPRAATRPAPTAGTAQPPAPPRAAQRPAPKVAVQLDLFG